MPEPRKSWGRERAHSRVVFARSLVVGLLVIGAAAGLFAEQSRSAARDRDRAAAEHLVNTMEREVTSLFEQWRGEILIAAQNQAFLDWKNEPSLRPRARASFESSLLTIHTLYPSQVGEACVIDRTGRELARQVDAEIAQVGDLSPDETGNAFFAPALALAPGQVLGDVPYRSPDTGDWVISVATPVEVDGRTEFVVHFEVLLAEIQRRLTDLVDGAGQVRVVDRSRGLVLVDTASAQRIDSEPVALSASVTIADAVMTERFVEPDQVEGVRSDNAWTIEAWVPYSEAFSGSIMAQLLGLIVALGALVALAVTQAKRVAAVEALRVEEGQFRRAFDDSPIGMALMSLDGTVLRVNTALCVIVGAEANHLIGHLASDVPGGAILQVEAADLGRLIDGRSEMLQREIHHERSAGTWCDCQVTLSLLKASHRAPARIVAQVVDETEARVLRHRLEHQATHDTLTGLPNRVLLTERTAAALERARVVGSTVALIFLDLDHFKVVNDSLGHEAGDELLVAVAERLVEAVRSWDMVGRLGGDEFVVLCDPIEDTTAAETVAERITLLMSRPFVVRGRAIYVSASLGVALTTGGGSTTSADLLREADTAAYRAKERGRARYELFDDAMRARAEAQLDLEDGLRGALMRDELRVHYQPIIDLASGRVGGAEALVRWEHPERGLLLPGSFIEVAEGSGLIVSLGLRVLDQVCRQVAVWDAHLGDRAPGMVTVNVSPRQLIEPDFVDSVREVFEATGIDPGRICLEITENALMEDVDLSLGVLASLKAIGVGLAIDDFGTGHSSLSYLRRFPVDVVKIDQSFIQDLGVDRESSSIVEAVVNLAHVLGLIVVAEGIETVEHLAALAPLGCDKAQGYYFGRPVAPDPLAALLATWEPHGPLAELTGVVVPVAQ